MVANIVTALVWGSMLVSLISCNIYAPFDANGGENDYIEAAQKCLHDGDYSCAIENYNRMAASEAKSQHLCLVYLARSGFTINTLVGTVKSNSATMLGSLADALIPWSAAKDADAALAITHCGAYAAFTGSGQNGVLLKTLSYLVDCATQLAKADQFQGVTVADTTCTTAGNRNGRVTTADINAGGGAPTMCKPDVDRCNTDFEAISTSNSSLGSSLSDIKAAINTTAGTIGASGALTATTRTALAAAVP